MTNRTAAAKLAMCKWISGQVGKREAEVKPEFSDLEPLGQSKTAWTKCRWAATITTAVVAISGFVYFGIHWENNSGRGGPSPTELSSFPSIPSYTGLPSVVSFTSLKSFSMPEPAALPTTAKPTTSIAPPRPTARRWIGTWTYAGHAYPAELQLFNTDPMSGEIHIPGWCDATWSEVQRASETSRLVRAHVISGNCHDNQWNVTALLPNSIAGTDTVDRTTTFEFTPQSS